MVTNMEMKFKSKLLGTEQIVRAIKRISHQIIEKNDGTNNIVIIGIKSGGIPVAHQIRDSLVAIEGRDVPLGFIDISMHRDDLSHEFLEEHRRMNPKNDAGIFSLDENIGNTRIENISGRDVILVDDVLFTGRTARAALDAVTDMGRASTIQLAVLIDRGHRELPIRADYVGKNVPTSRKEEIVFEFQPDSSLPVVNLYEKEKTKDEI